MDVFRVWFLPFCDRQASLLVFFASASPGFLHCFSSEEPGVFQGHALVSPPESGQEKNKSGFWRDSNVPI